MKNARFWIYHNNDFIKVTLRQGQALSFGKSERTDEGWRAYGETLTFLGDVVTRSCGSDETDCDGRHSWDCELECPLSDLRGHTHHHEDGSLYLTPLWQITNDQHRDHRAEAMGY